MKLRVDNKGVRFRLREADVAELQAGRPVKLSLSLPSATLEARVEAVAPGGGREYEMDFNNNILALRVHPAMVEELLENPVAGVRWPGPPVCVLEVDVKPFT